MSEIHFREAGRRTPTKGFTFARRTKLDISPGLHEQTRTPTGKNLPAPPAADFGALAR